MIIDRGHFNFVLSKRDLSSAHRNCSSFQSIQHTLGESAPAGPKGTALPTIWVHAIRKFGQKLSGVPDFGSYPLKDRRGKTQHPNLCICRRFDANGYSASLGKWV